MRRCGGWPRRRAKTYFPEKRAAIPVVSLRKRHEGVVSSTELTYVSVEVTEQIGDPPASIDTLVKKVHCKVESMVVLNLGV